MERVICIAIGYLFGLFQTGYIYGKSKNLDIRDLGSGNAGTTNALRTLGAKAGAITFIGDCLKAIAAVMVVRFIYHGNDMAILLYLYTGLGVVLGHNYPFYLKFKGGKGIASMAGLVIATMPPLMTLTLAIIFFGLTLITKYVSLGSLTIVFLFFVGTVLYGQVGKFGLETARLYELYGVAFVLMVLAFERHRTNISRLMKGEERKTDLIKMFSKK